METDDKCNSFRISLRFCCIQRNKDNFDCLPFWTIITISHLLPQLLTLPLLNCYHHNIDILPSPSLQNFFFFKQKCQHLMGCNLYNLCCFFSSIIVNYLWSVCRSKQAVWRLQLDFSDPDVSVYLVQLEDSVLQFVHVKGVQQLLNTFMLNCRSEGSSVCSVDHAESLWLEEKILLCNSVVFCTANTQVTKPDMENMDIENGNRKLFNFFFQVFIFVVDSLIYIVLKISTDWSLVRY